MPRSQTWLPGPREICPNLVSGEIPCPGSAGLSALSALCSKDGQPTGFGPEASWPPWCVPDFPNHTPSFIYPFTLEDRHQVVHEPWFHLGPGSDVPRDPKAVVLAFLRPSTQPSPRCARRLKATFPSSSLASSLSAHQIQAYYCAKEPSTSTHMISINPT